MNDRHPFEGELDHTKCGLGSWYYDFMSSEAVEALPGELREAFILLEEPHRRLHESAAEIMSFVEDEGFSDQAWDDAEILYQNETLGRLTSVRASLDNVVHLLEERAMYLDQQVDQTVMGSESLHWQ